MRAGLADQYLTGVAAIGVSDEHRVAVMGRVIHDARAIGGPRHVL